jgi:hypothetical protein
MSARRPARAVGAVVTALALVGAAACGDDEPTTEATTTTTEAVTTTTAGGTTTEPEAGPVEITAVDYAFDGVPESIAAGTSLSLTNSSDVEVHELVAVRLGDDETRTLEEITADPASIGALFGGGPPAAVLVAAPGSDQPGAVLGDGSLTEPGRYVLICSIPTGADPQAYLDAAAESTGGPVDVPGGPPHFVQGMVSEVVVE